MKKLFGLLRNIALVIVLLAVVGAFLGGGDDEKSSSKSSDSAPAQEQAEESSDEQSSDEKSQEAADEKSDEKSGDEKSDEKTDEGPSIATNAKYSVTIDDSRVVEDYDGAPCIAVDFTFTNVSDDTPTSMQLATNITVYQDGVECEEAWFADDNSDGYTNKVKAGVSVQVTRVYKLQNTTSDVEVEVGQLFSWSDDLLAYQVYKLS